MRAGRSRSWAAWFASALLHALLAALVLRTRDRAAVRAPVMPPDTVELEFEAADRLQDPPTVSRAAHPANAPAPRRRSYPGKAPASGLPSSSEPPPSAPPSPTQPNKIDLSFETLPGEVKQRFSGPAVPEPTLRARPGRFAVDELRVALERERDAVANVAGGRVDPLLYDYLRGARALVQETAERLADDLAVGSGDMVRGWGRGYLDTVDKANRGLLGDPLDTRREASGDARNEPSTGADVLGAYGEARRQAEAGAEERRAEVCLDVAAGREPTVLLRRSSGNAALDRVTLESFTKAIGARPVPPDARGGVACYELQITAYRVPPLPVVSCGVGRNGLTCVWPFKKVTSVKGRLVSVEYPATDGGDRARPSLLRKPR
jgi:hypothetical protein